MSVTPLHDCLSDHKNRLMTFIFSHYDERPNLQVSPGSQHLCLESEKCDFDSVPMTELSCSQRTTNEPKPSRNEQCRPHIFLKKT